MAVGDALRFNCPATPTTELPTDPAVGEMFFDTTLGYFVGWDGSTWVQFSGEAGGSGGDNITVNGSAATNADFDDATPAAPAGDLNIKWQKDASSPNNISGYVDVSVLEPLIGHDKLLGSSLAWTSSGHTGTPARIAGFDGGGTAGEFTFSQIDPLTTKGDLLVDDGSGSTRLAVGADGRVLKSRSTAAEGIAWEEDTVEVVVVFDGGGSVLTTGIKLDVPIEFNAVIQQVSLFADQTGSVVVDIWKDTYANFPPTVADTITAAAKPTLSSASKAQDATLTGWTTTITAGDILRFNIDSVSTITRLTLSIKMRKA